MTGAASDTVPEVIAQGLREYGAAIRGDWSELDGRSVRATLDDLADMLVTGHCSATNLSAPNIADLRVRLGVCPYGGGHWTEYCEDAAYCEQRRTERMGAR